MEKDIHASHKGQGAATNREKGQGVTRTTAGTAPCKNGLARTLIFRYKCLIGIMVHMLASSGFKPVRSNKRRYN